MHSITAVTLHLSTCIEEENGVPLVVESTKEDPTPWLLAEPGITPEVDNTFHESMQKWCTKFPMFFLKISFLNDMHGGINHSNLPVSGVKHIRVLAS